MRPGEIMALYGASRARCEAADRKFDQGRFRWIFEAWMRALRRCPVCGKSRAIDWEAKSFGPDGEELCFECGMWLLEEFDSWNEEQELQNSISFACTMIGSQGYPPVSDYALSRCSPQLKEVLHERPSSA